MAGLVFGLAWVSTPASSVAATGSGLEAKVEVEEEVYRYEPADNGAGPMWCSGSTCLVRVGNEVYAAGLETLAGVPPLNNCRWVLWRRGAGGWERLHVDAEGRTREPSPLAGFADGTVWVSANPTLEPPGKSGGGPARPEIWRFGAENRAAPVREVPVWKGTPRFTEHSYRSLAADAKSGELIVFQNIDYTHAEWAFRDRDGGWSAQGRLAWPWESTYARPQPVRICYPNVALRERAVHWCGVSDILEPNPEWRAFKRELTGREWDYDFRRLFYTWSPDVTREPFREWIEVASREATCGGVSPADLWLAPDGTVHLLWTERAIDERLRARFFPAARQSHSLDYAVVRGGRIASRRTLVRSTEDAPGPVVGAARFHPAPGGRLLVVTYQSDGGTAGNRVFELSADGIPGPAVTLPLERPFGSFFTATSRAGSGESEVLDLLGPRVGRPGAIGYARVRIR